MEWHYMVIPILFFGLHYILVTHLTERIEERRWKNSTHIGYHKLFFYCEVPLTLHRQSPISFSQLS